MFIFITMLYYRLSFFSCFFSPCFFSFLPDVFKRDNVEDPELWREEQRGADPLLVLGPSQGQQQTVLALCFKYERFYDLS
jgi:hypothetical protein